MFSRVLPILGGFRGYVCICPLLNVFSQPERQTNATPSGTPPSQAEERHNKRPTSGTVSLSSFGSGTTKIKACLDSKKKSRSFRKELLQ